MSREEVLEERYGDLQLNFEESEAQLKRVTKTLERTKEEYKKMEEKNQQQDNEISSLLIRMSKLEERAKEVDEKEEKIDLLTESLDKVRASIREKDFEVSQHKRRCDQAEKEVEAMKEKIEDLHLKNEDLKYQVRMEIERNSRMAQGLDEIEQMRELTAKTLKDMEVTKAELNDKTKLLASARRSIREYRDKTKDHDTYRDEAKRLREELQISQFENNTLKRMMVGKDSLVIQKTQALDLARQLIEHLKSKDERVAAEVERLLETTKFTPSFPAGSNKSDKLTDYSNSIPTERSLLSAGSHGDLSETRSGVSYVSRTSSLRSTLRPSSVTTRDLLDIRSVPYSRAGSDVTQSTNGSSVGGRLLSNGHHHEAVAHQRAAGRPQTAVVRPQQRSLSHPAVNGDAHEGDSGPTRPAKPMSRRFEGLARSEVERVASLFIHLGDRVQTTLPDDGTLHLATVKYIGQLDRGPQDRRIYIGLKMDEALGDCDGTHNGVRYFNVPLNRGRIVRVTHIQNILNIKTDQFKSLEDCLKDYTKHRRQ